jgi:hypothetical protein
LLAHTSRTQVNSMTLLDPRYGMSYVSKLAESLPPSSFLAISQNFNTRLRLRKTDEHDFIGPRIHNVQPSFSPNDDNREHALQLCAALRRKFIQSRNNAQIITYQEKSSKTPWTNPDPDDCAALDHTLLKRTWLPSCTTVSS